MNPRRRRKARQRRKARAFYRRCKDRAVAEGRTRVQLMDLEGEGSPLDREIGE